MSDATSPPELLTRPEFYTRKIAYLCDTQPEFDRTVAEAFFSLAFAADAITHHFSRRFQRVGLTMPGFNMLMILNYPVYRESGCPLSQLGDFLLVSKANVTGLMDSLEKRGLAERSDTSSDRRVKLARITQAGQDLLARIIPWHMRETRRVSKGLTLEEKLQLANLLTKFRQMVVEAGEGPDEDI